MDLKDFIAETICQIMDGVVEAQKKAAKMGGVVNPKNISNFPEKLPYVGSVDEGNQLIRQKLETIDFEIALTETQKKGNRTGIAVGFPVVSVGAEKEKGGENTALNKIKFSVTVCFPYQENISNE